VPGLVPQIAAWQRRMANLPGPNRPSGEASTGDPVTVELWVAGTWVDITSYCMVRDDSGQISITRGIRDEGSQTEQSTGRLQVDDRDGRFSPRNPVGAWYTLIGRNQPLRISVPDGMGGKSYRLWGEISEYAQGWDSTGTDVYTDLSVNGLLRRLAQGPAPERSVIYNAVTDPIGPSLVAYWPCEDATDATTIASALVNGSAMVFSSASPNLAASTVFTASDPLPTFGGASMSGGVTKYSDTTATQVRFLFYVPSVSLTDRKVLIRIGQASETATTLLTQYELYYNSTNHSLSMNFMDGDGTNYGADLDHTFDIRNRLLYVSVEMQESGSSTIYTIRTLDVVNHIESSTSTTRATEGLTRCTAVTVFPASVSVVNPNTTTGLADGVVGHITVENAISAVTALGTRLNTIGETAGRRIQRLCGEEGIPVDWVGDLDDTTPLGAQGKANPLSLMQEAALADGGMLYENLAVLGLGYRTRASLYNQDAALTLDYAGYNLAQVPLPVEDDQRLANKVTVTVNGVSATYEATDGALSTALPPAGVGAYGTDLSLNLSTTDTPTLLDQAAWRVHLGTVDEARYPQISVNLAHSSFISNPALKRAVLALRQGDRVQVQNPPAWLPPDNIDQIILGFDESLTHFEHRLTFTCAPASPYTVGFLDEAGARIDTDGSELAVAITSGATEIDVVPSAGQSGLWTTDSADAPWDVRVGGEVMTVTGVSSKVADSFTRTVSNGWGTAGSGQAWTVIAGAASERSVDGTRGLMTLTSSPDSPVRINTVVDEITDAEILVKLSPAQVSTGSSFVPGVVLRYASSSAFYRVRLHFRVDNGVYIVVTNASVEVGAQVDTGMTYAANDVFWLRARIDDHRIRGRAWRDGDLEPPDWHVDRTITSNTVPSGSIGLSCSGLSGITNPTLIAYYDEFYVLSPQTFFVTRSVNGVVKAQEAGEDVRLATPTTIAL